MYKLILFALACALVACSDNDKLSSGGGRDGGGDETRDAGTPDEGDDGGEAPAASGLERAPGSLQRPPGKKLPDDLKPPGYEK